MGNVGTTVSTFSTCLTEKKHVASVSGAAPPFIDSILTWEMKKVRSYPKNPNPSLEWY